MSVRILQCLLIFWLAWAACYAFADSNSDRWSEALTVHIPGHNQTVHRFSDWKDGHTIICYYTRDGGPYNTETSALSCLQLGRP